MIRDISLYCVFYMILQENKVIPMLILYCDGEHYTELPNMK